MRVEEEALWVEFRGALILDADRVSLAAKVAIKKVLLM